MAHIDAGKTTTTERILFYNRDYVQDGEGTKAPPSWTGWRGAGAASPSLRGDDLSGRSPHQHHRHARPRRFHGGSGASLRVLDGAVAVFDSVAGVERSRKRSGARPKVSRPAHLFSTRWTHRRGLQADLRIRSFPSSSQSGRDPAPHRLEDKFLGVVDLIKMKAITYKTRRWAPTHRRRHPKTCSRRRSTTGAVD